MLPSPPLGGVRPANGTHCPTRPWGETVPRIGRGELGVLRVVCLLWGIGCALPPRHTCTARTPYSNALSLEARRYTLLTLSEYGAPPTEGEGVPV